MKRYNLSFESNLLLPLIVAKKIYEEYHQAKPPYEYDNQKVMKQILGNENIYLDYRHIRSEHFCGLFSYDEDDVSIVINTNISKKRQIFTLAHEIGHYYLHRHINTEFPDTVKSIFNFKEKATSSIYEQQANLFASELLIPEPVLKSLLSYQFSFYQLVNLLNVSSSCLMWRLVRHLYNFKLNNQQALDVIDEFMERSKDDKFNFNNVKLYNIINQTL